MQGSSWITQSYSPLKTPRSLLSESLRSSDSPPQWNHAGQITSRAPSQTASNLASALVTQSGVCPLLASDNPEFALENYRIAWKLDNLSKNMDASSTPLQLGHLGPQTARSLAQLARTISPYIDEASLQHPRFEPLNQAQMDQYVRELSTALNGMVI
ncbi:MAG TPA: hypothetical protein VGE55_06975 [Limnobacter sp.]|uniref:hypothetical protein n=1 Tax=Limnobacter sp. TaxID=2003368 RepID=UPI002ED845DF